MIYEVNRDGVGGKHLRLRLVDKTQLQNASPATFPPFFSLFLNQNTIVSQKNTHAAWLLCRCGLDLHTTGSHLRKQGEERRRPPPPGEQIQREAAREEKFKSPKKKPKKTGEPQEEAQVDVKSPPPKKSGFTLDGKLSETGVSWRI